jgi:maleylacetoacetate isomerase
MKLYTYFRSSAAYRVRIALNLKGIGYEAVPVDLRPGAHRQPDYLSRNPQGLIPALEDAGAVIAQSLAIIEYLEETHPRPPLLPASPLDRARVRSMALAIACDIHPLNNLRVLNYLRSPLGQDEAAVDTWYRHWIAEGLRGLEEEAKRGNGDGRHMFGTQVTLADVCLVPQMFNARRFKCDVEPFPTLRAICAHLETVPAFARAAPEVQPDASAPAGKPTAGGR